MQYLLIQNSLKFLCSSYQKIVFVVRSFSSQRWSKLANQTGWNHRVLKSHGLMVVWLWICAKSWDLHAQTKNVCILTCLTVFSSCFTNIRWFLGIFLHFFLCKISKLKFWPRKKSTFRISVKLLRWISYVICGLTANIKTYF